MDFATCFAALALPSGTHIVTNHGTLTALIVQHADPNTVTIRTVKLATPLSLEEMLRTLHAAGALPSQLTPPTPVLELPSAAPESEREPCPNRCGALLVPGKPGQHLQRCPNRPSVSSTVEHTANPSTLQSPLSSSDQERPETTAS